MLAYGNLHRDDVRWIIVLCLVAACVAAVLILAVGEDPKYAACEEAGGVMVTRETCLDRDAVIEP